MSKFTSILPRALQRAQRRFRVSRPGSVLILCVALLVLLALIGTAMISTARVDRYSSQQHSYNTEVDLLVEGVKSMAQAAVVNDLWDTSRPSPRYRFPRFPGIANKYDHWDMPQVQNATDEPCDLFLASRYPDRPNPQLPFTGGNQFIWWKAITAPLAYENGSPVPSFESPYVNPTGTPPVNAHSSQRTLAIPDSLSIPGTGAIYPALTFTSTGGSATTLAADADGDGIADSGLIRLPVGTINGITYYAGIRIVDNNSAINVNTAWSQLWDFKFAYTPKDSFNPGDPSVTPGTNVEDYGGTGFGGVEGFYRTNVGLLELLHTYTLPGRALLANEMDALNVYRFSGSTGNASKASLAPASDKVSVGTTTQSFTYNHVYANESDALEHGLVCRLDNPDINVNAPLSNYTAFSPADTAALASHFCVQSRESSPSNIENKLLPSLIGGGAGSFATGSFAADAGSFAFSTVQNAPYVPNNVLKWYTQNFYWDRPYTPSGTAPILRLPLRSMLVARNPVSNLIPAVTSPLPANGNSNNQSNVLISGIGVPVSSPDRSAAGMAPYHTVNSQVSPVLNTPVVVNSKTDVNTAGFGELWRAFWCVMADSSNASVTIAPTQPPLPYNFGDAPDAARMFRSTLRNLGATTTSGILTPSMVMQLRSALAAVNTLDLRDTDDDITSVEIPLKDMPAGNVAYTARVYGTEMQPFITEIYVNTFNADPAVYNDPVDPGIGSTNSKGYIAIELYNPYPVDLTLHRWAIGFINRPSTSPPAILNIMPLATGTLPAVNDTPSSHTTPQWGTEQPFLGGGTIIIPARSHVILENYPPNGTQRNTDDAAYRPYLDAGVGVDPNLAVYVPHLADVIGNEVVLLRPHRANDVAGNANGNLTSSTTPTNWYNEGTIAAPNLQDFVPIDSYDFTGLTAAGANSATIWHYTRASGPANEWKFVYPGLYLPPNTTARQKGTFTISWDPTANPAVAVALRTAPNVALTNDDAVSSDVNNWPGIQLVNTDWPSYNRLGVGTPTFPFGFFARNGDILQIPFIGAYEIRGQNDTVTTTSFVEMNSVSMDCSFVDDQERVPATGDRVVPSLPDSQLCENDNVQEQLGRFCPLQTDPVGGRQIDDYDPTGSYDSTAAAASSIWKYHFAAKLFDYLTVQSPASDYKPNVDPLAYTPAANVSPVQNGTGPVANPVPASALPATTAGEEMTAGVEGLININTAPWWVLASLPLLPNDVLGPGAVDANNNGFPDKIENLAKQIVLYRDGDGAGGAVNGPHGPFRSIFDLNRVTAASSTGLLVPVFRDAIKFARNNPTYDFHDSTKLTNVTTDYDATASDGDISPHTGTVFPVPGDFEDKYLMVNRISNLITTRSDSFTVYIVVQGWRNAGTATPELVVQRRAAMIIDRSNVTGVSGAADPKKTAVATD